METYASADSIRMHNMYANIFFSFGNPLNRKIKKQVNESSGQLSLQVTFFFLFVQGPSESLETTEVQVLFPYVYVSGFN